MEVLEGKDREKREEENIEETVRYCGIKTMPRGEKKDLLEPGLSLFSG
jgi:hypothetical protein